MKNKMKSKKAATKRFKMTASGKLERKHSHTRKNTWAKTRKQKRHLAKVATVHETDQKRIAQCFQN